MAHRPLAERFAAKVVPAEDGSGCMLWRGWRQNSGRGVVWHYGSRVPAHAIAWELAHGRRLKPGQVVLQLCGRSACVAVEHLRLGTKADLARLLAKRRETCRAGHPRTRENVHRTPSGERRCRRCDADHARRRYQERKASAA